MRDRETIEDVHALLPHEGRACWIAAVLAHDAHTTRCLARIPEAHPLCTPEGMPASAALEWMAQAAAIHLALGSEDASPVRGVVASVRGFESTLASIPLQAHLEVRVRPEVAVESSFMTFEGELFADAVRVAHARLGLLQTLGEGG